MTAKDGCKEKRESERPRSRVLQPDFLLLLGKRTSAYLWLKCQLHASVFQIHIELHSDPILVRVRASSQK